MNSRQWEKLEHWSPVLLCITGGFLVLIVLPTFIEFKPAALDLFGSISKFLIPVSTVLGIAGVAGLYPKLSKQAPQLSWVGTIFLVVAGIVFVASYAGDYLVKTTQNQSLIPLLSYTLYTSVATRFAGHLVYSIAAFRSDHYPNTLGYLLLILVALTVVGIPFMILQLQGSTIKWIFAAGTIIEALAYLALGYLIKEYNHITYPQFVAFWSTR